MQLRLFVISLGVALLAACAAPRDTQVAAQDPSACRAEYRTGTNIPVKSCTAMSEDEQRLQQEQTDQVLQNIRSQPDEGVLLVKAGASGG
jgi:uncharacterized lipoprotein YajG